MSNDTGIGQPEQLARPVDRMARHLYDALKSIEAANKVLAEEHSHPYRNTVAVTLREAWHTLDRRLAETADYRPDVGPTFSTGKYRGYVCDVCGEELPHETSRDVHFRGAQRGLGCPANSGTERCGDE